MHWSKQMVQSIIRKLSLPLYPKIPHVHYNSVKTIASHIRLPGKKNFPKISSENDVAHAVIERYGKNTVGPSIETRRLPQPVLDMKDFSLLRETKLPSEFLRYFEKISLSAESFHSVYTDGFHDITKLLCRFANHFSDEELVNVLKLLSLWVGTEFFSSGSFRQILEVLSSQCGDRIKSWNRQKCFLVLDCWYNLRVSHVTPFVSQTLRIISEQLNSLTCSELVQFMFHVSVHRKLPANIDQEQLEEKVLREIYNLGVDEIAIVALGFFKSGARVKNPILTCIIMKETQSRLDEIHDVLLNALLKLIRRSCQPEFSEVLFTFLRCLVPQLAHRSHFVAAQGLLCAAANQLMHKEFLLPASLVLMNALSELRLKDLESLVFILSWFTIPFSERRYIFYRIADEMKSPRRKEERISYPKSYVKLVAAFVIEGLYFEHLMQPLFGGFLLGAISDFVLRFDHHGCVQPVPPCYKTMESDAIRHPLNDKCLWFCILIGCQNMYNKLDRSPCGLLKAKVRQLMALGYLVAEIPWFEYEHLNSQQKEAYITRKLNVRNRIP